MYNQCLTLNDISRIWLLEHEIMLNINAGGEKSQIMYILPQKSIIICENHNKSGHFDNCSYVKGELITSAREIMYRTSSTRFRIRVLLTTCSMRWLWLLKSKNWKIQNYKNIMCNSSHNSNRITTLSVPPFTTIHIFSQNNVPCPNNVPRGITSAVGCVTLHVSRLHTNLASGIIFFQVLLVWSDYIVC